MKYTPELGEKLLDAIRNSATLRDAWEYVGISHATYYYWKETKPEFAESLKKAIKVGESNLENYAVSCIQRAMEKSWQAAAWWLERTKPDKYGKRDNFNIENGNSPINIKFETIGKSTTDYEPAEEVSPE